MIIAMMPIGHVRPLGKCRDNLKVPSSTPFHWQLTPDGTTHRFVLQIDKCLMLIFTKIFFYLCYQTLVLENQYFGRMMNMNETCKIRQTSVRSVLKFFHSAPCILYFVIDCKFPFWQDENKNGHCQSTRSHNSFLWFLGCVWSQMYISYC